MSYRDLMVGLGEIQCLKNTIACQIMHEVLDEGNGIPVRNHLSIQVSINSIRAPIAIEPGEQMEWRTSEQLLLEGQGPMLHICQQLIVTQEVCT